MNDDSYTSAQLMRWLWHDYLKKHTGLMAIAVIFMIIEGSTLGVLAKLMEPMFDRVFVGGDQGALRAKNLVGVVLGKENVGGGKIGAAQTSSPRLPARRQFLDLETGDQRLDVVAAEHGAENFHRAHRVDQR